VSRRARGLGRAALLAAAGLSAWGCLQDDGRSFNPLRSLGPPEVEDERELGAQFDAEIRKHVILIDDPVVLGYVNDLGQQLAASLGPQPFPYRFRVVRDSSLNAFAVPGGYVYLHSGTLLAAGSPDELAGVIGHEIGHVKGRHFARMQEHGKMPELLANLAGMAAAVATGEPGILVAAQAANVAMQLRWSREFEAEADQSAVVLAQRSGYDPAAITHFFERVLEEQRRLPAQEIPPYLFSHPEVESRIDAVEIAVAKAEPAPAPAAEAGPDRAAFEAMQARLAVLVDRQRASLAGAAAPGDPARTRARLEEAEALAAAGRVDEALAALDAAAAIDPGDPRIPFRQGELLDASGRHREAILAYQRTLALDATRALVFFRLGEAWAALGDRGQAVYAFEQARDRSGAASPLRQRAEWELAKQAYGVLSATGVSGVDASGAPELGVSRDALPASGGRVGWWGRLSPRFEPLVARISVRWIDPAGTVVRTAPVERLTRPYVGSVLEIDRGVADRGLWRVEALIDDDVIDRRNFRVQDPR